MSAIVAPGLRLPHTAEQVTAYVVATAVWAPSVHNTQPWQFIADGAEITLRADVGRQLAVADPSGREMMMSCGAALFTAKLALRSLGYVPETRVLPDPTDPLLIARLRWRRQVAPATGEERLFNQVTRRRTHRGGFEPVPPPAGLIRSLRQEAAGYGAALRVAITDQGRAALAAITEMADRVERLDSAYVRELAAWAPPPGSALLDGVPPSAYPARPERTRPNFPARDFARGSGWGLPSSTRISAARYTGVVCLLTTPADGPESWVNAGQALQCILLSSTASGVAAALHSQPVEVGWLREAIREQLGDGSYPQLVIRLGTAIQDAVSVRRAIPSVLTAATRPVRAGSESPVAA
jgi:nitroreductase